MKSSYRLRPITTRTTYADGSSVTPGPAVGATYPIGLFREDYEYIAPTAAQTDYLDSHNGRFCITPEYPSGTYAYFCTVDAYWNSAYPYAVGPTFYGNKTAVKVTSITEPVTIYTPPTSGIAATANLEITAFPNPTSDFIAVQTAGLLTSDLNVAVSDMMGRLVQSSKILQGSTITYIDTRTLYSGEYLVRIYNDNTSVTKKVLITK